MTVNEFLTEFDEERFPSELGPVNSIDDHDPPFTAAQLRDMTKRGFIVMVDETHYRLTLKATRNRT